MGWIKVPGSQGSGGMSRPKKQEGELFHHHKNEGGKGPVWIQKSSVNARSAGAEGHYLIASAFPFWVQKQGPLNSMKGKGAQIVEKVEK